MSDFIRYLSLRPYGKNLITKLASFWFSSMAIIMLIMATTEGLVWATITWNWLPKDYQLFSIMAGGAIFILIWIIDAQLIMYDLSKMKQKDNVLKVQNTVLRSLFRVIHRLLFTKYGWGINWRVVVIGISLYVTAPALLTILLTPDYSSYINSQIGELRQKELNKIKNYYEPRIDSIDTEVTKLSSDYQNEVAGKGVSGIKGVGPIAKAIEAQLENKRDELSRLRREYREKENDINSANALELKNKYGADLPTDSVSSKFAFAKSYKETQFIMLNTISKTFLILVFGSLLSLKLFQPKGVDIYLNEEMQYAFIEYLDGKIDHLLDEPYRISMGNVAMTPYNFAKWYVQYKKDEDQENGIIERNRHLKRLKDYKTLMEKQCVEISNKLKPLVDQDCELSEESQKNHSRILELITSKGEIETILSQKQIEITDMAESEMSGMTIKEKKYWIKQKVLLNSNVEKFTSELSKIELEISTIEARNDEISKSLEAIRNHISTHQKELSSIEAQQRELSHKILEEEHKAIEKSFNKMDN